MAKVYVATSWRNQYYPEVVSRLREAGFDVYDFRNPPSGDAGFHWENVSEKWLDWSLEEYRDNLHHPLAECQFKNDIEAMKSCNACILVLPYGCFAHTEAGWFAGKGKTTIAYIPIKQEPELMYKLFDDIAVTLPELEDKLKAHLI